jgi:hypothetical protein
MFSKYGFVRGKPTGGESNEEFTVSNRKFMTRRMTMRRRHCELCDGVLTITDLWPDSDTFDLDLAIACGYSSEQIAESWEGRNDDALSRFRYISPVWQCSNCETCYQFPLDADRSYYNPIDNCYNGARPMTPMEQIKEELARQELAGQMRLPL